MQSRFTFAFAALLVAAGIWIPSLHLFFRPAAPEMDAKALAERQLQYWQEHKTKTRELEAMRGSNPEWDFMGRTFLALALCEMCERDPGSKAKYLTVVDSIIDETLALERARTMHFFLMSYSRGQPFRVQPERSIFVDGEIAVMLGARRLVEEKPVYKERFSERVAVIEQRLRRSPVLAAESYPNECWLFDHSIALAALRLGDSLDATDHSSLFRAWSALVRKNFTHPESGIIVSAYTTNGQWLDGPEGSSIWAAVHFIRLFDPPLAEEQYRRARGQLARTLLGFGWSREWPLSWRNVNDIDSGAVIPVVDAGAAASGLALLGAGSFHDLPLQNALRASLNFAAFPVRQNGTLRYCGSNAVGDATLLYALTLGPLWDKALAPKKNAVAAL